MAIVNTCFIQYLFRQDAKQICQDRISLKINTQVFDLMEGMAYDWIPKDVARSPSNGLEDVIRFLYSHFQIFTSLPVSE